jgi:DNA-binding transcriptional MerR regulator
MIQPRFMSRTMPDHHTIGQLARRAQVPVSTVRYYERRGLLQPDGRSDGNYRLYSGEALSRLQFIRSAQAAGFTLGDITALLRFQDDDGAPCQEVQSLIAARQVHVTEQIAHLKQVDRMLRDWMSRCREAEASGRCGVLEGLEAIGKKKCDKNRDCP